MTDRAPTMPQARVRHAGLVRTVLGDHATAVRPRAASRCRSRRRRRPGAVSAARPDVADAGLGQHELDAARALPVAGERGDDRADLLVAGAQQERRRAAVALHAHHEDALVGVAELVDAVRRHRAARVQVRVDQRSERSRRLDAVVEVEPQLAEQREVGPEAGRGDHLVGLDRRVARRPGPRGRRPARRGASGSRRRARPSRRRRGRGRSRRARRGPAAGRRPRRRTCGRARRRGSPRRSRWPARSRAASTRSRIALNAEWPLPTTSTRRPA